MDITTIFWSHSLTILWILPLIGIGLISLAPSSWSMGIGLVTTISTFIFAVFLGLNMDFSFTGYQFLHTHPWISTLGTYYRVGIDGLSYPFIIFGTFLFFMATLSHYKITSGVKGFFSLFLLLEASFLGIFVSLDVIQFIIFWLISVLSIYGLIGIYGKSSKPPLSWITTMSVAAALFIAGIGLLYVTGQSSILNFEELSKIKSSSLYSFIFLAISFSMMSGIFPFHLWFLKTLPESPAPLSIIMSGGFLWIGLYGWIRMIIPLFSSQIVSYGLYISIWFLIHFLYSTLSQLNLTAKEDSKAIFTYTPLSLMGLMFLGLSCFRVEAIHGIYLLLFSQVMITILFDSFENRFVSFISLLMPFLLIVIGLFQFNSVITFMTLMGILFYAISIFLMAKNSEPIQSDGYEKALGWILLGLLLVISFYPNFVTAFLKDSMDEWIRFIQAS